ncbi:hypothetical protein BG011_000622 [Mortierella polycephala]|uniref:Uncharacterized protein n=1 Tax=Mortierella polycephala TaxID=41804 RepID=A0A9P6PM94_9FUNG|nr:hypothetical protein BG011_000622 [Mortierella polycephala]
MALQDDTVPQMYQGRFQWINVPFPVDPTWNDNIPYSDQYNQYHAIYKGSMPKVPAMMTHCEATQIAEPSNAHGARVYYRSMVLKPKKWVIALDTQGLDPINGDECGGEFRVERDEEEILKLRSSIEFSSDVSASGSHGPVKASANLKMNASVHWEKTVTTKTKRVQTAGEGSSYQPTYIYAKLLCEMVCAKAGDFLVDSLDDNELITTNPYCSPVQDIHRASKSGYVKSRDELQGLYLACGKYMTTYKAEDGSFWAKGSSARIQMVVDPVDARLYVKGYAVSLRRDGILWAGEGVRLVNLLRTTSAWDSILNSLPGSVSLTTGHENAKLDDYHGLQGEDAMREDMEITYSPGNLVKIWKVAVKAIHKRA